MQFKLHGQNKEPDVQEFQGGYMLANPSEDHRTELGGCRDHIFFKSLDWDGVFPKGGLRDEKNDRRVSPYLWETDTHHVIRPGELLVLLEGLETIGAPTPDRRAAAMSIVEKQFRFDLVEKYPHLDNALGLFGDKASFKNRTAEDRYEEELFTGNKRDHAWWSRYHFVATGERYKPTGGLNANIFQAQDGPNNCEYDALYFMGVQYLRTGRMEDWLHLISQALTVASCGVIYTGKHKGKLRYPKGGISMNGDSAETGWSKQWFTGILLAWYLSNKHPVLQRAVDCILEGLRIDYDWDGNWGCRIGARYLESLRLAFLFTNDEHYEHLYLEEIQRLGKIPKPEDRYFQNRGTRKAPEKAWMMLQLTDEIQKGGDLFDAPIDRPLLKKYFDNCMEDALTRVGPHIALKYSMGEYEEPPKAITLLAFALPEMRRHNHPDLQEAEDFVYNHIGSTYASLRRGMSFRPEDIGMINGPEGMGGIKQRTYVLRSLLT